MLNRKIHVIAVLIVLLLGTQACTTLLPQTGADADPVEGPGALPRTEDDVPRVTVEEAKAALDSGEAVIVDVRNTASYDSGHIPGAVSIPLDEIEADPTAVDLAADEWIITYCT